MPPKKLSESDKQEILDRYCHSDETTVTLSSQYGVSTSTISRILKQSLPEDEYETLVQKKRYGTRSQTDQELLPGFDEDLEIDQLSADFDDELELPSISPRRQRKRSTVGTISAEQLAASLAHLSQLELAPAAKKDTFLEPPAAKKDTFLDTPASPKPSKPILKDSGLTVPKPTEAFVELEDEDLEDEDELDDEDLGDEDDLDDENLEDDLDDGFEETDLSIEFAESIQLQSSGQLQILPIDEAPIPRTCYVVVDRSSELITRPLKDFAELGQIPTEEVQERTLPIFDNHRVAKRFLRRMQRIVKVPDGRIFQKVRPYLKAKGITHLLIDGQVYSLNER